MLNLPIADRLFKRSEAYRSATARSYLEIGFPTTGSLHFRLTLGLIDFDGSFQQVALVDFRNDQFRNSHRQRPLSSVSWIGSAMWVVVTYWTQGSLFTATQPARCVVRIREAQDISFILTRIL